jgi:uracil-DNA glycosylase family 4
MNKAPYAHCDECTLKDQPYVPWFGPLEPELIFVGEAPGAEEVREGKPFVGPSGRLLDATLINIGHDPGETYRTNCVMCRPPQNRTPTDEELLCCYERLLYELASVHQNKVVALGKAAGDMLHANEGRGAWNVGAAGLIVLKTWHPAYVLRKPSEYNALEHDLRKAYGGMYQEPAFLNAIKVHIPDTYETLERELSYCPPHAEVSFDIESDQVQWYDMPGKKADAVLMLGISWNDEYGVIINDEMLYDTEGVIPLLQEFFNRSDFFLSGHNSKFDEVFLQHTFGLKIRSSIDTMTAHYVLNENERHGLKAIAWEEFSLPDYEEELLNKYLKSRNDYYSKIPFNEFAVYCATDLRVTRTLSRVLKKRMEEQGLWERPYKLVLLPAHDLLVDMELAGVKVDIPYLVAARVKMELEQERVAKVCADMMGLDDLNLSSWMQVGHVLWDVLKLPQSRNPRLKPRSTNEEAVMHLKGKHPFVDQLLYYRHVAKLKASYIDNMLEFADVQGRVHPSWREEGTEIGRLSARDPAVQTIPRPGDKKAADYSVYTDGAMIRGAVIANEGCKLVICDYSQAELRVIAVLSNEQFLLDVYANDRDLHTEVATAMHGPDFTKEQRVQCKMFNFSYIYGGSEYSFALDAGLPIPIATAFVRKYNSLMPNLLAYRKSQYELLVAQGYVETIFGRRRRFPLITQENRDEARKAAVHQPVAGTASDLTLLSAVEAWKRYGYTIVLLVHDSIVAEVPNDKADEAAVRISGIMCEMGEKYLPQVKWKADSEVRSRWVDPPTF